MNLDRRSFAKSLTGVVGSLIAGPESRDGVHTGHAGFPGARAGQASSGEDHQDPRLLPAELRQERAPGLSAKQHGCPGRHRRRDHRHRSGWITRYGAQRRQKRHRQNAVRYRDDLAGGVHGRLLFAGQGAAARARRHRSRAVGHQGQGARCSALPAVRR